MFCVDLLAGYHRFVHTALQSIPEFADIPYIPVSINLDPMPIALIVVLRVLPKGQAAIFNLTEEARIVETDRLRAGAESYAKLCIQTCRAIEPIVLTTIRAAVSADIPSMSAGG